MVRDDDAANGWWHSYSMRRHLPQKVLFVPTMASNTLHHSHNGIICMHRGSKVHASEEKRNGKIIWTKSIGKKSEMNMGLALPDFHFERINHRCTNCFFVVEFNERISMHMIDDEHLERNTLNELFVVCLHTRGFPVCYAFRMTQEHAVDTLSPILYWHL